MAKIRIRYLTTRPRKNGTARYYWQPDKNLRKHGWKLRDLGTDPYAAQALAQEINAQVDEWRAGMIAAPANERPGTMAALIESYKRAKKYTELAPKTRKEYDRYLALIRQWAGDEPAAGITARACATLYDKVAGKTKRKAEFLIRVLSIVFAHGLAEGGYNLSNPASSVDMDYQAKKGRLWTPDDIRRFVTVADELDYFSVGTAVMLNEWMGQRRGDLLRMTMHAYREGTIFIRQNKTGAEVNLPVDLVADLKTRIERQVAHNKSRAGGKKNNEGAALAGTALIQQKSGRPYTDDGFKSSFDNVRREIVRRYPEMKGLVFKDLRHTAVTRMAEAGATIPQIAAVTGHTFKSCQDIIDRYNVRTTRMAREAFARRLNAETKGDKS